MPRGKNYLGEHGWPMMSRSTAKSPSGRSAFQKSRDTCASRPDSQRTQLAQIRHVRFDSFFHLTQVFSRTVEVTICIILERLLDCPRQLPHVNSHNSPSRPKAAQGSTKTDYGGADGWQPKSPPTASGRGNQPAGSLSRTETAQFSKQSVANKSRHS